jgi:hypothetical protein
VLELTNNTKKTLRLRMTGSSPILTLDLKGKDSIVRRSTVDRAAKGKVSYVLIEPGKTHEMPIKSLAGFSRGTQRQQWFWTEPGDYTLGASFQTLCYEVEPGGVVVKGPRNTRQTATAEPIALAVKSK